MCRKTLPRSKGIETPTTSPLSGRGTRRKTRPELKGLKLERHRLNLDHVISRKTPPCAKGIPHQSPKCGVFFT